MNSVCFKTDWAKRFPPFVLRRSSFVIPWSFIRARPPAKCSRSDQIWNLSHSPQRSLRTQRKKFKNNLCALRDLCGEIKIKNRLKSFIVSYERGLRLKDSRSDQIWNLSRSPQRSLRTQRKKIKNNLCALRDLCGEIKIKNRLKSFIVSYERVPPAKGQPVWSG